MQAVAAVLEIGELALAGHAVHELAPATAEYVPAPQSVHVEFPGVLLYFPATHCVHVPPLDPNEPALHVQAVTAVLKPGEFELLGHPVHAVPVALW